MTTACKSLARQRRIRLSENQWRELFARFERSGQTREQFCAEHDLVLSSFTRWWRKLRSASRIQSAVAAEPLFVEWPPADTRSPWDVELELGAGLILRLRRPAC